MFNVNSKGIITVYQTYINTDTISLEVHGEYAFLFDYSKLNTWGGASIVKHFKWPEFSAEAIEFSVGYAEVQRKERNDPNVPF